MDVPGGPPFWVVDTFTSLPWTGEPVAVVFFPPGLQVSDEYLANVAAEFSVSNTSFVWRRDDQRQFDIRWLTSTRAESMLAGHATLAAAHVLATCGLLPGGGPLTFITRSGNIEALIQPAVMDEPGPRLTCDFPSVRVVEQTTLPNAPDTLRVALGGGAVPLPIWVGSSETNDLLVVFESAEVVRTLVPSMPMVASLAARGVIVTAACHVTPWAGDAHFVCRWFAPSIGIPEGAVTGSAHCALGPFWAARLGRNELIGFQTSQRAGTVAMRCDLQTGRTMLQGRCVSTLAGNLLVLPNALRPRQSYGLMSQ